VKADSRLFLRQWVKYYWKGTTTLVKICDARSSFHVYLSPFVTQLIIGVCCYVIIILILTLLYASLCCSNIYN